MNNKKTFGPPENLTDGSSLGSSYRVTCFHITATSPIFTTVEKIEEQKLTTFFYKRSDPISRNMSLDQPDFVNTFSTEI